MQVDEAGQRDEAVGLDHVGTGGRLEAGADLADEPVGDEDVGALARRQGRAADQVGVVGVRVVLGHRSAFPSPDSRR